MARVLSGIQPSGDLHLGNYLGAIRQWVDRQGHDDAFYCIVDLHAITQPIDPAELRRRTLETAAGFIAAGLDPEQVTIFVQSHVAVHPRLAWLLECTATMGELNRMTQFKDKGRGNESVRVGLFTYPVLMAADILAYDASNVPVGEDQRQHLELTRDLATRFNHHYGHVFVIPEATIPPVAARVMDLQQPDRKMSKSIPSPLGRIDLFEDADAIAKKVKKAVTDADGIVAYDPVAKPGVSSLLDLLAAATNGDPAHLAQSYTRYGDLKGDVADALVALLSPMRARYLELMADETELRRLLATGATKAEQVASATYARAASAMGLLER
jgi:tryptophanyl-tRNA synthetase